MGVYEKWGTPYIVPQNKDPNKVALTVVNPPMWPLEAMDAFPTCQAALGGSREGGLAWVGLILFFLSCYFPSGRSSFSGTVFARRILRLLGSCTIRV